MKEIRDMSRPELLEYFKNKKIKGASYGSIANIIAKNNIDNDTRKWIINNLEEIDESQKIKMNNQKNKSKRSEGIVHLLIGIAIMIIGIVMFYESAKSGIVFIFNILLWGVGGILMLRGVLTIATSIFRNKTYR
jgi:hypothetical protein